MGTIQIGRLGYAGLKLEGSPGSAETTPDVYLPYTDNSLREHHESIEITAAKTSRLMDKDSVVGKKWSEGDLAIDLDVINSGYLWKMALGNEQLTTGTPNYHTFYATYSGNAPKTATIRYGRGDTDYRQFTYCSVDELTMEVSDGLATLTASMLGDFPTSVGADTVTTTSGTVFAFKDMSVKFGADLSNLDGSATPVNDLTLTIANNLELIHRSGSNTVSAIRTKGCRVSGSYTVFFDSTTDRDAYIALNKRAMEITFSGNSDESLRVRIPEFRLSEGEISTGLDDFFIIGCEFVAEDDVDSGVRLLDIRLSNTKGDVY